MIIGIEIKEIKMGEEKIGMLTREEAENSKKMEECEVMRGERWSMRGGEEGR